MNLIEKFQINQSKSIEILVPNLKNKFNYYYEPTAKLHMFDIIAINYKSNDHSIKIFSDALGMSIDVFHSCLKKALENKIELSDVIKTKELGYQYNIDTYDDHDLVDYSNFWLWSGKTIQTWIYNKNNKIYLEIAPSYPWLYREPEKDESAISFDEFIKSYKPILAQEISRETAQKWLEKCNKILEKMVKP